MKFLSALAFVCVLALPFNAIAQKKGQQDPFQHPFANPVDNPALPRVLIVGDSISIGYTPRVRRALQGKANVHRPKTNCRWSAFGAEHIGEWVGTSKWDVIHFNFGLWDWYGWSQPVKATPESYGESLESIVKTLKTSKAKLVFGVTTPPCIAGERKVKIVITEERAKAFNTAAIAVMKKHGVIINDLYATIGKDRAKYQRGENDVHYTEAGRDLLAAQVAKTIAAALPKKPSAKGEQYAASVPEPSLTGIRYGDHERHVMDLWKAKSQIPTPLAFVIHGGGWKGGSKERVDRFADVSALLEAGISVVAMNYRYVTQAGDISPPVKAPLHDAARALQFVRSKAAEWNIDKSRVGAAGGSAGACSSLWLAFHDDLANPDSNDPVARESSRLSCAAVKGAQTTLDPQQMKTWTPNSRYGGHAFGLAKFDDFLAGREDILPWITEYSPYANVSADDPPVYLTYTAPPGLGKPQKDPTHTSNFGVKLQEHCRATGTRCELVYPGATDVKHETATAFLISILSAK